MEVPETSISSSYIEICLGDGLKETSKQNSIVVWLGNLPELILFEAKQGNKQIEMAQLEFFDKKKDWQLQLNANEGKWIAAIMPQLIIAEQRPLAYKELKESYETATKQKFENFSTSNIWLQLRENGLLIL